MEQLLRLAALLLLLVGSSCTPLPSAMEGVPLSPPLRVDPYALELLRSSVVVVKTKLGHGSGVCIARVGEKSYYLTAAHVVDEVPQGEDIELIGVLPEGGHLTATGKVVKIGDPKSVDLALIEGGRSAFPVTAISRRRDVHLEGGETLFASGYPLSIFPATVTIGYHIRTHSIYTDHTASIWFGNSGGPLVDSSFEVVGVNVLIAGCESGPHSDMGRAIRLSIIKDFVKEYVD